MKKRLLAIVLVGVMALGMSVPAFAEDEDGADVKTVRVDYEVQEGYVWSVPEVLTVGVPGHVGAHDVVLNNGSILHITCDDETVTLTNVNYTDYDLTLDVSFTPLEFVAGTENCSAGSSEISVSAEGKPVYLAGLYRGEINFTAYIDAPMPG